MPYTPYTLYGIFQLQDVYKRQAILIHFKVGFLYLLLGIFFLIGKIIIPQQFILPWFQDVYKRQDNPICVTGAICPAIIMSKTVIEKLTDVELSAVFIHELTLSLIHI